MAAVLYSKIARAFIKSIDRSSEAANYLAKVGLWLTVVVGLVGVLVSVAVTLWPR